jgi:hypothetical protein
MIILDAVRSSGRRIGSANAQSSGNPMGFYSLGSGYGNVWGTFGHAAAMQSMYNIGRLQAMKKAQSNVASKPQSGNKTPPAARPPVVRNYGVFRPDPTVNTGKLLADNLADTPEDKALIREIYKATKSAFDKEAGARGFKNNIAGGITFFTVAAVTVYHDVEEPSDDSLVLDHFKIMNSAIDEIPEFGKIANKEKQSLNNMLIGFSGILLATYMEAKDTGNAETLASSKQLAKVLIEMVLKTDPENIRVENGKIVMR